VVDFFGMQYTVPMVLHWPGRVMRGSMGLLAHFWPHLFRTSGWRGRVAGVARADVR
jgi:hypothetical protein